METIIKVLIIVSVALLFSTLGGVIMWACWDSLSTAFPTLGVPQELSLWTSIKLSWLFAALFKASSVSSNKE